MFDQRNQQFSTILVATAIVLSGSSFSKLGHIRCTHTFCLILYFLRSYAKFYGIFHHMSHIFNQFLLGLITVLIQGVLPIGTSRFLQVVYAISNSGSMALLFICSVLCLEVIWRASQFMYKRSKVHTYDLGNAIKKTKEMMTKVRGIKAYEMVSLNRPKSRRHISGMTDDEILIEFAQHEKEIQHYLQQRQRIIDKAAYMVFSEDGTSIDKESFSHFWRDSCGFYSNAAILFFYMWARFDYALSSPVAAQVSVYLISFALIISFSLVIYLRYYDRRYIDSKVKFERDNRKAELRLNIVEEEMRRTFQPSETTLRDDSNGQ
jgi:uncharacterized membrane protein YciS (DUF1049 family)